MLTTNTRVYIKVNFFIPLISSYLFQNVFCTLANWHISDREHWKTDFSELDARVCCRACMVIEEWVGYQHGARSWSNVVWQRKKIDLNRQVMYYIIQKPVKLINVSSKRYPQWAQTFGLMSHQIPRVFSHCLAICQKPQCRILSSALFHQFWNVVRTS